MLTETTSRYCDETIVKGPETSASNFAANTRVQLYANILEWNIDSRFQQMLYLAHLY